MPSLIEIGPVGLEKMGKVYRRRDGHTHGRSDGHTDKSHNVIRKALVSQKLENNL